MTTNKITPQLPFSHSCTRRAFGRTSRTCFSTALAAAVIVLGGGTVSAQTTNVYWAGNSNAIGGSGTWNMGNTNWSTNPAGGAGTMVSPNANLIFNFTGTPGTVTDSSGTITNSGINVLINGYTLQNNSSTAQRKLLGIDATATGTTAFYITNSANLNIGGAFGFIFDALTMTGGADATLTLTNTSVFFGESTGGGGRTNFINTIIAGANTNILGSLSSGGFTQAGNIINNSAGRFIITNNSSGTVNIFGAISGSGSVTLANSNTAGRISLGASNSYVGGTVLSNVASGSFGVGNSSAFGSGTITSAGSGVTNNIQPDANNLNVANNWQLDAGNTLRLGVNNGTNFTASGNMAGSGNVIVGGTNATNSTVILSGNNTYTGTTTVNSGATLQVGSANALGGTAGGTTVSSGATLDLNGQTVGAEPLTLSGTGVGAAGALRNTSGSTGSLAGPITLAGETTIGLSAGNITLSGNVGESGGARSLVVAGTNGVLTLSGSNNYSGQTIVTNTVTVRVTSVDSLSINSSLSGASATNRIPTLDLATAGSYKMNSFQGGNMNLLATNGASSLTFTNTGTGNLVVGGSRTITASNVAVTFDGSVNISPTTNNKTFTVAGDSDFTFNGSILTTNTGFSSEFRASSTGRTTLNASNNYDGLTTVSAGATLRLANSFAMGAANGLTNSVANGGALQLQGGITVDGEILALNGRGVSDNGALRNISGNNTYNGLIELNATNRINSDAGTLTVSAFTNGLSSSKQLIVGGAGNTVMSGAFTGTGSGRLVKDGAGTLTISAANTVNGGITVGAGSLIVSSTGSINEADSSVIISNGANLHYNGTTALRVASVSIEQGGGLDVGTSGSVRFVAGTNGVNTVSGAGTATFQGTFNVEISAASTNAGSSWTLVSVASRFYPGSFNVAGFTNSGGTWTCGSNGVTYQFSQSTGILSVASSAPVSAYNSWLTNYPSLANTNGDADPDGDGFRNNMEFAFDGDPTVGSPAMISAASSAAGPVFSFLASTNTNAVTYVVQSTTDLSTVPWADNTNVTRSIADSANQTNPAIPLAPSYVRREFTVTPAGSNSFYRVKATIAP